MSLNNKIRKFVLATKEEKVIYFFKLFKKIYILILPFFRLFKLPFVSGSKRRNIFLDFSERMTNLGKFIRYRYYLGFKLFYSCSKNGTGIVNHIMFDNIYEKDTCVFLKESLRGLNKPSFVDVGANIGLISLFLLKNVKDISIYAFEPSPHQHMLFKKTIEENNIAGSVKLFDLALSDTSGTVPFFMHNEANCSGDGFYDTGRGGDGRVINVIATPLDLWWQNNGKVKIDLIKVDTEGAELFVFKGAKELITECHPCIFFEMQEVNYRVYNYTWRDVLSFFESINYSVYTESGKKLDIYNTEELMLNNYNFIAKSY